MTKGLPIRGRITASRQNQVFTVLTERGSREIELPEPHKSAQIGDIVEWDGKSLRVLTRSLKPGSLKWATHVLDPRRVNGVKTRRRVERLLREFFESRDFIETRTPTLVPCPGMETHIRTFKTESGAYLPTSPEFAMKRLLVGGLEKIFQICSSFRYEPNSRTHHPEFTMLEWYRAYADMDAIMKDTEELFEFIAIQLNGKPEIEFQGSRISLKTPWPRLTIRELFKNVGIDLVALDTKEKLGARVKELGLSFSSADTWDDLYFRVWLNLIEPKLPSDQAVFVTRYPRSQAALAVLDQDPDGSTWAKRFELYAGGFELGNAFEELTDAKEQRARFIRDMNTREEIYGSAFPKAPLDEDFISALEEGMPPSGGIAVGVDRMVMLFGNETDIGNTVWLPSYPGSEEVPPSVI